MVSTQTREPDLSTFTGVTLLRMVATALVDLSQHGRSPDPIYSDRVLKAYNHVVLQCLQRRIEPGPRQSRGRVRDEAFS